MQIDWITVAAQIVNFLILVWLLQRFLYGPITRAMARREERISERLREAERKKGEAENEAQAYRRKQEELARRRDAMLAEAQASADEERKSLEEIARDEVDAQRRDWQAQLRAQRETFLHDLRQRSAEEFYLLARRALSDLADADMEEKIALIFARQLNELDSDTRKKIVRETAKAGEAATIHSRFELSTNAKRRITKSLHECIGESIDVVYEPRPDIASGIELKAGSQTLSWSIRSYLDGFEQAVSALIPEPANPKNAETER